MNKTTIDWCDYSWNPITGCLGPEGAPRQPHRCKYCYANLLALGRLRRSYLANPNVAPGCDPLDPFSPRFWPNRLKDPCRVKQPSKVFVCSMGELFHPAVPDEWREQVADAEEAALWHTYIHLTKQPQHLPLFMGNTWVGITAETQRLFEKRYPYLAVVSAAVRFVSVEPIFGSVNFEGAKLDWVILGDLSHSEEDTIVGYEAEATYRNAKACSIPIFVKDNLAWAFKLKVPKEWPRER